MKMTAKMGYLVLAMTFLSAAILFLYLSFRPVNIIAVHKTLRSWNILVDHLPPGSKQKISWWHKNKEAISKKYPIPNVNYLQEYNISIWQFGDGYKELGKYDRFCFNDMPPPKNCIEKKRLMYITLTRDGEVSYWLNDTRYVQKANGELYEIGLGKLNVH